MKTRVQLVLLFIFVRVGLCQVLERSSQNPCSGKSTCRECIRTAECAWCMSPTVPDEKRCFHPSDAIAAEECMEKNIYNPSNDYEAIEERALYKGTSRSSSFQKSTYESSSSSSSSSFSSSHHGDAVQISPQNVRLKLRMNKAFRMSVDYAQAEDYPVDLYYLMDLSNSMKDDKDKLSSLGNLLVQSMKNITSNFKLGFGSFVDKVVMPYVSTVPKKLESPCNENCTAPYGFKNVMSLSVDTGRFAEEVRKAPVSGNLDAPEGGFDAIMQAIVCRPEIGWRDKARRLLVFSTDAGFHYAGDGKLGGIVRPNDGECHLDGGMYSYSSILDYPSISQINVKVKQNAINIIFAVTSSQQGIYEELSKLIQGSSAGVLSDDSSNIVELVKDQYNKITSSVEMKDTASKAIKVTYSSNCLNKDGVVKETNKCDGLKVGNAVRFMAKIEVRGCPANKNEWIQNFQIYPVGINESLNVQVEMQCDCPCERPDHYLYEAKSDKCNGFGTYQCGICQCDENRFGRKCECDENTRIKEGASECRPDNTSTVDCSGRGQCICGQCTCNVRPNPNEVIEGTYCECDNFSCDRENGVLCSGPEHGVCRCGKCECREGWSGPVCGCRTSTDTCMPPGGGEICSGKGNCECGVCKCNTEEEGRFSGKYCEKCPTCPGRCLELKDCVQCQVHKKGPLSEEECAANCTTFTPVIVDDLEVDESRDENICSYYDEDDCRFVYVYTYDERGKLVVRAQKDRECPPEVYVLGIVLGVIGAIVLIGLAILLLWKVVTSIHDRREFARFEKERKLAKWDTGENPIYKQATSTFKNPTYAGK